MEVIRRPWVALAVFFLTLVDLSVQLQYTTDAQCKFYLTNTTTRNWYKKHKFFDFRDMTKHVRVPAPIHDPEGNANAVFTDSYFNSTQWKEFWQIQAWNNGVPINGSADSTTRLLQYTPNNVYFQKNDDKQANSKTWLTLRTVRHPNFQSAAEIASTSGFYQHVSMRMLARTKGAPGAITAMFTYRGAKPNTTQVVQEADMEIRTQDPLSSIQYTNQPAHNQQGPIPEATQNVTKPDSIKWSDWQVHRLDWTPGSTNWFVNGKLLSTISFQNPRDPSYLLFNAWSDGGSWSGDMAVGGEAYLQIKWIDLVYNSTKAYADEGYTITNWPNANRPRLGTCSIDETALLGTPVLLGPDYASGPGCASAKYGQCAGKTWNGCSACAGGSACRFQNDYYSQCL